MKESVSVGNFSHSNIRPQLLTSNRIYVVSLDFCRVLKSWFYSFEKRCTCIIILLGLLGHKINSFINNHSINSVYISDTFISVTENGHKKSRSCLLYKHF